MRVSRVRLTSFSAPFFCTNMEKWNVCHHNVLEKNITSFRHSEKFSKPWGTELQCLDYKWAVCVCVWVALVVGTTLSPLIGGWGPLPERPGRHKTRSVRPAALTTAGPTWSTACCMFQALFHHVSVRKVRQRGAAGSRPDVWSSRPSDLHIVFHKHPYGAGFSHDLICWLLVCMFWVCFFLQCRGLVH